MKLRNTDKGKVDGTIVERVPHVRVLKRKSRNFEERGLA